MAIWSKVYIVMPVYNEQVCIEQVINDWLQVFDYLTEDSRLLIIDDGSTDGTSEILSRLSAIHPELLVIRKENGRHGPAVMDGYKVALSDSPGFIFQTDSDGQTSPADFVRFCVPFIRETRYTEDAALFGMRKSRGDGRARKFVEKVLCRMVKHYFGVSIPDANAPFRIYKAETLKKYIDKVPDGYALPNVLLTSLISKNETCAFVSIHFGKRETGKNSINVKKIFSIGMKSVKDFRTFKKTLFSEEKRGG